MKQRAIIPLAFAASLLGTGAQAGRTYDDIATAFNLGPAEELVAAIETCTTQGTDWSQVTLIGKPNMMAAIRDGNLPAIDAFLQAGVDLNATDPIGFTAAMELGATADHRLTPDQAADLVVLFHTAGADFAQLNDQGASALHLAALLGYPEVVQAILDTGLSADLPDAAGRGPIAMLLSPVCRAEVGLTLIENGATLGTIPNDLHEAFCSMYPQSVPKTNTTPSWLLPLRPCNLRFLFKKALICPPT